MQFHDLKDLCDPVGAFGQPYVVEMRTEPVSAKMTLDAFAAEQQSGILAEFTALVCAGEIANLTGTKDAEPFESDEAGKRLRSCFEPSLGVQDSTG